MKISFKENTLYIGTKNIKFGSPIDRAEICGNIIVVLLNCYEPNNIFAVDDQAHILWQVQDAGEVYSFKNDDSYVGIRVLDDDSIIGTTFNGLTFQINSRTGKINKIGMTK